MDHFYYQDHQLYAESVAISDIIQRWGTPCYIYSRATLERHWQVFDQVLAHYPHRICYAVKANSNIAVLNVLARLGSGFDIVSGGELARVLAAGGKAKDTVFSGVAKSTQEITHALQACIFCINVESKPELERIQSIAAQLGVKAPISLRVNPNVDPQTHPYIATGLANSKFGIPIEDALALYQWAKTQPNLAIKGIDCHIGSQITSLTPFLEALDNVLSFNQKLKDAGIAIEHLNMGGGLAAPYTRNEAEPPSPKAYAEALLSRIRPTGLSLILEPGRAIAANAGILVTRIEYLKRTPNKNFALVDAGMHSLLRPALYQAWHDIIPVAVTTQPTETWDIVGPICETADTLGKARTLSITAGDLLAVRSAGAYGFTMSSVYNSHPTAAEVMVDGDHHHLIRQRGTIDGLFSHENCLP